MNQNTISNRPTAVVSQETQFKNIKGNHMNNPLVNRTPVNNILNKRPSLKVGTGFSGIGSPEQGLKEMNIDFVNEFMIEIDKFSRQTYQHNHSVNNVYTDITTINPKELPSIDLFVFGSPCQSFSIQGKRQGLNDTRGTLIYNGLEIIKEKQPKFFIYENVNGLVNHDKGNTFKTILLSFEELGYNFHHKVLNTKDYGLPQNRERIFIVGTRKDIKDTFVFPEPLNIKTSMNDFIIKGKDYSEHKFDSSNVIPNKQTNRKNTLSIDYVVKNISYQSDRKIYSSNGISPCFRRGGSLPKINDTKNNIFRYMTLEEMTLIQGFRNFEFPVSKTQQKYQIGNSMSVNVIQSIYKNLLVDYINIQDYDEYKKCS